MNIGSSLSAINAFSTQMNVTAKNIANVGTDGYKSQRVVMENGQGQNVNAAVMTNNSPGPVIPGNSVQNGSEELSNVDMVTEMTQLNSAQMGYDANLKVMETNYQMQGNLINMFA